MKLSKNKVNASFSPLKNPRFCKKEKKQDYLKKECKDGWF